MADRSEEGTEKAGQQGRAAALASGGGGGGGGPGDEVGREGAKAARDDEFEEFDNDDDDGDDDFEDDDDDGEVNDPRDASVHGKGWLGDVEDDDVDDDDDDDLFGDDDSDIDGEDFEMDDDELDTDDAEAEQAGHASATEAKRAKRAKPVAAERQAGRSATGSGGAMSNLPHSRVSTSHSTGRLRFTDLELSMRTDHVLDHRQHRPADFERMIERTKKRRFKKHGVRARKNMLPSRLINVMGEANKAYTRQAYDTAEKLCNQVISEAPDCPDPYITLSLVFEEKGDKEACFESRMRAAKCMRLREVNWAELADLAEEIGRKEQATRLLRRAYKLNPEDLPTLAAVIRNAEQRGKPQQVVRYCGQYLTKHGPNVTMFNRLYKLAANKSLPTAVRTRCLDDAATSMLHVLTAAKDREDEKVDPSCILMTVDLLSQAKKHKQVVDTIIAWMPYCCITLVPTTASRRDAKREADRSKCPACYVLERGATLLILEQLLTNDPALDMDAPIRAEYDTTKVAGAFQTLPEEATTTADGFHVPDGIKLYFRVRLALSHLALDRHDQAAQSILLPLLLHSVDQHYALFSDAITALIEASHFHLALRFCEKVRANERWDKPMLWLRMGRCYHGIGDTDSARAHIDRVLATIPRQTEALRLQREVYKQAGIPLPQSEAYRRRKKRRITSQLTIISNNAIPTEQQLKHQTAEQDEPITKRAATAYQKGRKLNPAPIRAPFLEVRRLHNEGNCDGVISSGHRLCLFFLQSQLPQMFLKPFRADVCRTFVVAAPRVDWEWEAVAGSVSGADGESWLVYHRSSPDGDPSEPLVFNPTVLTLDEWLELFVRVSEALINRDRCFEVACMLHRLVNLNLWEPSQKTLIVYLETIALQGAECYDAAFLLGRSNVFSDSNSSRLWAAVYPMFFRTEEALHAHRFVLRRLRESPSSPAPHQAQANHSLMSSTYNYAAFGAAWATSVANNDDDRALATLTHGVACLRRVIQRSCPHRRPPLLKALLLLRQYVEVRGGIAVSQEAVYNLARAYHYLGLFHVAAPLYRKALALPSVLDLHRSHHAKEKAAAKKTPSDICSEAKYKPQQLTVLLTSCLNNLRRPEDTQDPTNMRAEAAFNLALVYRTTSPHAAGQLLRSSIAW